LEEKNVPQWPVFKNNNANNTMTYVWFNSARWQCVLQVTGMCVCVFLYVCVCVWCSVYKRHIRFCSIVYYNIIMFCVLQIYYIVYKSKRARLIAFLPKTSHFFFTGNRNSFFLCFVRHFSALKYLQQTCYKNIHTHIVLYCRQFGIFIEIIRPLYII